MFSYDEAKELVRSGAAHAAPGTMRAELLQAILLEMVDLVDMLDRIFEGDEGARMYITNTIRSRMGVEDLGMYESTTISNQLRDMWIDTAGDDEIVDQADWGRQIGKCGFCLSEFEMDEEDKGLCRRCSDAVADCFDNFGTVGADWS